MFGGEDICSPQRVSERPHLPETQPQGQIPSPPGTDSSLGCPGSPLSEKWFSGTNGRRLCHYCDSALVHSSTRDVRSSLWAGRGWRARRSTAPMHGHLANRPTRTPKSHKGVRLTTAGRHNYTEQQQERLKQIQSRLTEARRELDALIGDAYLRPRANIVPVHFLDLASACLLYTSDAADDLLCVDLGGRR